MIDDTSIPPIIGIILKPDVVGLSPFTTWRKSGRYVTDPNSAKPTINPTTTEMTNVRFLKRRAEGRARLARFSTKMNAAVEATATAINARMSGELHGYVIPPRSVTTIVAAECSREKRSADVVDRVSHSSCHVGSVAASTTIGDDSKREIDVEDPSPREMRREVSADEWSGDARETEHGAEIS